MLFCRVVLQYLEAIEFASNIESNSFQPSSDSQRRQVKRGALFGTSPIKSWQAKPSILHTLIFPDSVELKLRLV